ncbi:MAG: SRPBCC family protein [Nitrospinae bacterium]|nr:SRPBCC family protein [Nitrospinota bacterium]
MKEIVGVMVKLSVPAEKVWKVIASVGGVDKWSPMITSCRVEGAGPGSKRFCEMGDGTKLNEVVDEIDESHKRFKYRITSGLPVEGYEGTIEVKAVDGGATQVTWWSAYAAGADVAEGMRQMIREALGASLLGLEKYCRN